MAIVNNEQLTPREHLILESEKEENRLSREHAVTIKELELAVARENNEAEIKLKTLESKWSSWLKLPKFLILLPVLIILSIAFGFRREAPKAFWKLLN